MRVWAPIAVVLLACCGREPCFDGGVDPPPRNGTAIPPEPPPDPPDPPPDPEALLAEAESLIADGAAAEAANRLEDLLEAHPDHAHARALLAIAGFELGEPDAREHAEAAMDAGGLPHGVWVRLGDTLYTMGDPTRSLACYEAAFALEPTDPDPMERAAMRASAAGEWERAVAFAASALGLNPGLIDARIVRARALARLERYAAARFDVTDLLDRIPESNDHGHDADGIDWERMRAELETLAAWLDERIDR